jgi:hypothetical protein
MAAYIRRKRSRGSDYYQLVESHRVEGKPRQKVLVHLGSHPTVDDALREWPKEIRGLRHLVREARALGEYSRKTGLSVGWARENTQRAASAEKRANKLEANLKKLRELRKHGRA